MTGEDRAVYDELQLDFHTRLGVVATSTLRQVVNTARRLTLLNVTRSAPPRHRGLRAAGTGKTTAVTQFGKTHEAIDRVRHHGLKYFSERISATFISSGIDLEHQGLFTGARVRQIAGRFTLIPTLAFPFNDERRQLVVTLEDTLRLYDHALGSLARLDRYLHQRTGGMMANLATPTSTPHPTSHYQRRSNQPPDHQVQRAKPDFRVKFVVCSGGWLVMW